MTLVRIVKNWERPDILRQTPGGGGVWDDVRFTLDPVEACDYLVVLNKVPAPLRVRCQPQNIWAIMQEPPNEVFRRAHRGAEGIGRVYTQDTTLRGRRYHQSQPALPWHVERSYDELLAMPAPAKERSLSWITSNLAVFAGHRARLQFLERLRAGVPFDLFGRGFDPIADKWDGLAPYRYTIVVENFQNAYYWSEKIADPLLAWTMPIYYGCTRIGDYLPEGSFIAVDINDPTAIDQIQAVVSSDLWLRNRDAIAEARRRILQEHQLFPFLTREIRQHQASAPREARIAPLVTVTNQPRLTDRMRMALRKYAGMCLRRVRTAALRRSIW
jgi:hypothetical protein